MIQCVGSREEPRNYCSRVCCPTSLKHALKLKELDPDMSVYILYRDMMTPGFLEGYFTEARERGVIFIQYDPETKPGLVMPENSQDPLYVAVVDPLLGRQLNIRADLLVLATGIVPQLDPGLADLFGAHTDQDGFFQEADAKWRPVDALKEGVFACGITLSPRSIPETIASAQAAAQHSLRLLSRKRLPAGKIVATVRHSICSCCERCIDTCPYGARSLDVNEDKILVNPVMCQGCGDCAAVCPNSAAVVQGFADSQVMDMIDAALY
jgi:heterodisulfide reductase subunit A